MKRAMTYLLPAVLLFTLSTTACKCHFSTWDHDCSDWGENGRRCNDGRCHECCIDDDCFDNPAMALCSEEYTICNDDYECECVCYQLDEDCSRAPGACCDGMACDLFTNTCRQACADDVDCHARVEIPFSGDLKCKNGVCDFDHCNKDTDCAGGKVCYNGDCVTIGDSCYCTCVILPAAAVTRQGASVTLAATPYLQSGAVAPGWPLTWSSSDENIATVDDGTVTGGASTGFATITATVVGIESATCTATVTNYGAPLGTRVIVVDDQEFYPIADAAVTVGSEGPVMTDAEGVATFSTEISLVNPQDITVVKKEYNYITLRGAEKSDVIVHLSRVHHLDYSQDPPGRVSAGVKNRMDFSMIRCEEPLKRCDVRIGLGGISFPPDLFHLGLDSLFNQIVLTEMELGGNREELTTPEGVVFCLNQTCFKEFSTPTGVPGNRVVWSLGAKIDLPDMIDLIALASGGEEGFDAKSLILGLLPFFSHFYTAMVPNVDLAPRPMVPDTYDIDGDPETDEVPDYDNFPPTQMTLRVGMDQSMNFIPPTLPVGTYDSIHVIGGVIVRGAGFAPLGLSAGLDSLDEWDTPDGVIDDNIIMDIADVAGRIPEDQVQRTIFAVATNSARPVEEPEYYAVQVLFVDSFSGNHYLAPFPLPAEATYDPATRSLKVVYMPSGVDYLQSVFLDDLEAGWHVLGEWAPGDYTLPPAPAEGDRAATAGIFAVDLDPAGYQDVLEFNDTNLGNLVEVLAAFSYSEVP